MYNHVYALTPPMNENSDLTVQSNSKKPEDALSASASRSRLKAVVLYGELESAMKAKVLLGRATQHAGWTGETEILFWRFDVMARAQVAREALYRAADADIILLVAREIDSPPDWMLEWLEIWAISRRIQDAILVAWCLEHGASGSHKGAGLLRDLAGRYRLEFLCAEDMTGAT